MHAQELAAITEHVRAVAERIQPLLAPHQGLALRNAHAHVWLGVKVMFGDDWRERATPESVQAFVAWVDANPNAAYESYRGPVQYLTAEERGQLF